MKKLIPIFIVLLFSLTFSNCKKKSPEPTPLERLPERTETGEEKLVGIVNNEYIFSNNGGFLITPNYGLYSWYSQGNVGFLHIHGFFYNRDENWDSHEENLFIELNNINGIGDYLLNERNDGPSNNVNTAQFFKLGKNYHTDSLHTGLLKITKIDTANRIVAGTFNLNLVNDETNQTISITHGWFDIKY